MTKYAIIGDVHGCYDELISLYTLVTKNEYRNIIFLGDLLDKGPHPDKVVQFARTIQSRIVLGNHEEKHFRFDEWEKTGKKNPMGPARSPEKYKHFLDCRKKLLQLDFDAFEYLKSFSYYYYVPNTNWLCVHGGLEKNKKPEQMHHKKICRVRNLDPKTGRMIQLDKINEETPVWTQFYSPHETFGPNNKTKIVYGHLARTSVYWDKWTVGIDTGCVYGNKLTALLLPEEKIVSIQAKNKYAEVEI